MRHAAMMSSAVAGVFMLASAAVAQANWYHESGNPEGSSSVMTSPSSEAQAETPEPGTYQYEQALETGMLPPGSDSHFSGARSSRGGEDIQVIDEGGFKIRLGIDTQ